LTESGDQETKTSEAKARIQFGKAEEVEVVEEVDKIVSLHQMALAQREAEEKAKQGDYGGAAARMDLFSRDARSKGYGSLANAAKSIESRVGSAQDYSNNAGFLRSMSYGSTRSFGLSASDGDATATLSECNVTDGNSAMSETVARFTSDETPEDEELREPTEEELAQASQEDVQSADSLLGEAEADPITTGNNPLIWVTNSINSTSEK
jgi:hypothetical protein